ncbi:WG repeat-containing protein [Micromonospora sp. NPDC049102]|uniref:WG repeat-containing protein n=1 Tax=Micromonospora sp. NPDC049102 TaxID=3364265 RepID=UPI0037197132
MNGRYTDRWRDPNEPSWVVEPTTEWQPQFPGQRYPGDIGATHQPPPPRGRASAIGRAEVPPLAPTRPDGTYLGRSWADEPPAEPDGRWRADDEPGESHGWPRGDERTTDGSRNGRSETAYYDHEPYRRPLPEPPRREERRSSESDRRTAWSDRRAADDRVPGREAAWHREQPASEGYDSRRHRPEPADRDQAYPMAPPVSPGPYSPAARNDPGWVTEPDEPPRRRGTPERPPVGHERQPGDGYGSRPARSHDGRPTDGRPTDGWAAEGAGQWAPIDSRSRSRSDGQPDRRSDDLRRSERRSDDTRQPERVVADDARRAGRWADETRRSERGIADDRSRVESGPGAPTDRQRRPEDGFGPPQTSEGGRRRRPEPDPPEQSRRDDERRRPDVDPHRQQPREAAARAETYPDRRPRETTRPEQYRDEAYREGRPQPDSRSGGGLPWPPPGPVHPDRTREPGYRPEPHRDPEPRVGSRPPAGPARPPAEPPRYDERQTRPAASASPTYSRATPVPPTPVSPATPGTGRTAPVRPVPPERPVSPAAPGRDRPVPPATAGRDRPLSAMPVSPAPADHERRPSTSSTRSEHDWPVSATPVSPAADVPVSGPPAARLRVEFLPAPVDPPSSDEQQAPPTRPEPRRTTEAASTTDARPTTPPRYPGPDSRPPVAPPPTWQRPDEPAARQPPTSAVPDVEPVLPIAPGVPRRYVPPTPSEASAPTAPEPTETPVRGPDAWFSSAAQPVESDQDATSTDDATVPGSTGDRTPLERPAGASPQTEDAHDGSAEPPVDGPSAGQRPDVTVEAAATSVSAPPADTSSPPSNGPVSAPPTDQTATRPVSAPPVSARPVSAPPVDAAPASGPPAAPTPVAPHAWSDDLFDDVDHERTTTTPASDEDERPGSGETSGWQRESTADDVYEVAGPPDAPSTAAATSSDSSDRSASAVPGPSGAYPSSGTPDTDSEPEPVTGTTHTTPGPSTELSAGAEPVATPTPPPPTPSTALTPPTAPVSAPPAEPAPALAPSATADSAPDAPAETAAAPTATPTPTAAEPTSPSTTAAEPPAAPEPPAAAEPVSAPPAQAGAVSAPAAEAVDSPPDETEPVSAPPAAAEPAAEPVAGPPATPTPVPAAVIPGPREAPSETDAPVSAPPSTPTKPARPSLADEGDPEQVLAAYRWRLDPVTLREELTEPDGMRAIRRRLTGKLGTAVDNRARARLLSLRAVASRILGDLDDALADGRLALTYAEATGELRRTALAQARLAHVLRWRGDFAEADQLFAEANSNELPDRLRAALHEHAGRCCYDQGRLMEACHHFERALDLRGAADAELLDRVRVALDAVTVRASADGFGPYLRSRDEVLDRDRPPQPDRDGQLWGYTDQAGEVVVPARYAEAQPFHDGLAWVRRPDTDRWSLINMLGTTVIPPSFRAVRPFSDGLAWVVTDGGWTAIDPTGAVQVPPNFADVRPFRRGLAAVKREGWGAVDRTGRIVVPTRYHAFVTELTDAGPVDGFTDEGLAVVDVAGRRGVVDRTGTVLVPPSYPVVVIHPVAFLVSGGGRWGALDRRGASLIDLVHPDRGAVLEEIDRLLTDANPVL